MTTYYKSQAEAVKPEGAALSYPAMMQIVSEHGRTKWINIPNGKIDQLLALLVSFGDDAQS